jgi:cAMP-dependent protein kinase regulator
LERIRINQGEAIIAENTPGDNLFLFSKARSRSLKNLAVRILLWLPHSSYSGSFFGEMAIVDEEPRSASVIALEDVELLIIPENGFITCPSPIPSLCST